MRIVLIVVLIVPQFLLTQEEPLWRQSNTQTKIIDSRWEGILANKPVLERQALDVILEKIETNGSSLFSIPHPEGGLLEFVVQPYNLLAPGLPKKFPNI